MVIKEQRLGKNVRMSFSKARTTLELPNLLEVQTKSYKWFLEEGLGEVLQDVSPITDYSGNLQIDFLSYTIDPTPKYPVEECKERDANYAAPLRVNVRLTNKQTGEIKQTDIYMGDFPLMTDNGTFVINGAERVIVSQIVRSPGMYYASDIDKSGKRTYTAQVIPYRGAWLEYETDINGVFYVRIDKNRKLPVTMFIRALSVGPNGEGEMSQADIYEMFGEEEKLVVTFEKDESEELALRNRTTPGIEALKEIYKKLRPGEPPLVESAQTLLNNYFFDPKRYDIAPVGRYKFDKKMSVASRIRGHKLAEAVVNPLTGEVVYEAGEIMDSEKAKNVENNAINACKIELDDGTVVKVFGNNTIYPDSLLGFDLRDCGIKEKVRTNVLLEIMEECGGDVDAIKETCRRRIAELCPKHITKDDIFATINYLLGLSHDVGVYDDIDHLGNRRIRSVGEQLQNQMRIGFTRMDKIIKERMT
ncbi:MAG: DNA-directed RNA polymerase subunit beta, partial [Clostridia bacterium]|nr:DNA-directed RNA polymerase subunit beta [Clostridia bacterium]